MASGPKPCQLPLSALLFLSAISGILHLAGAIECQFSEPNSTVTVEENTICVLNESVPALARLEVRGTLKIAKVTPPVEIWVDEIVVYSTGKLSAAGQGHLPGNGSGVGNRNGSGGKGVTFFDITDFLHICRLLSLTGYISNWKLLGFWFIERWTLLISTIYPMGLVMDPTVSTFICRVLYLKLYRFHYQPSESQPLTFSLF